MSNRTRKNHRVYANHTKKARGGPCEFCNFSVEQDQVLETSKNFWVVKNIFPYDIWDTAGVKNHLMIVPKRHVDSIAHFTPAERQDYMSNLAKYESKGFSIYARAATNKIKSVAHQHTHLIETDNHIKRYLFFISKPHMLFTK